MSEEEFEAGYDDYLHVLQTGMLPPVARATGARLLVPRWSLATAEAITDPIIQYCGGQVPTTCQPPHRTCAYGDVLDAPSRGGGACGFECSGWQVRLHKATYGANAPSEDRSTVVFGQGGADGGGADFVFTGAWHRPFRPC